MHLPNWIAADRASGMEGALASLCRCAGVTALILATSAMAVGRIDLTELSLEELMDLEVTSVSRKAEKLAEAAAAVAVITREDMRRSGATSLPAALRLAPGLHVVRSDASKWGVAARGFNGHFVDKLLVLIDGRSVYTPLFSGVFWEVQDLVLEDVERIEVIRGPGATLWGANAVNGIINVMTRQARETQGGLVEVGTGSNERAFGTLRYGGRVGRGAHYRVYAKFFERDGFVGPTGADAGDSWSGRRGGFRLDWDGASADALTLQGDAYDVDADETLLVPVLEPPHAVPLLDRRAYTGGNVLGRWRRTPSAATDLALQLYCDWTRLRGGFSQDDGPFEEKRYTVDIDAQQRSALDGGREIVWGLGYRWTRDAIDSVADFALDPPHRTDQLFSAFAQGEIPLAGERLRLTAGSKFERNNYTGFEFQPSVRLLARLRERQVLWLALSRAVRTPTRLEEDIRLLARVEAPDAPLNPTSLPIRVLFVGNRAVASDNLLAWEAGYRAELTRQVALDAAFFVHVYDDLLTAEPGAAEIVQDAIVPHINFPFFSGNKMEGATRGGEFALALRPAPLWRVQAAYTYLQMDLDIAADSGDPGTFNVEDQIPHHQFALRVQFDPLAKVEVDLDLRYVDDLEGLEVDSYAELDARVGWRVSEETEISLVGQNLLQGHHLEFSRPSAINSRSSEVERGMYAKLVRKF